ncbi:MAG: flavodoxin reductase, partial [Chromatiales bacterium]
PFIAILRDLASKDALEDHRLLFSNKSPADIICAKELRHYLGGHCKFICTGDADAHCEKQRIDTQYLRENIDDFEQHFYLCGPPGFMDAITEALKSLGADPQSLVFEQ